MGGQAREKSFVARALFLQILHEVLHFSISEQLLSRNVEQEGLVFNAHRLMYHSILGSRAIKKKKEKKRFAL